MAVKKGEFMMAKNRPNLTMSRFIYLAATNPEFREKYVDNVSQLFSNYEVSEEDRKKIDGIDMKKLQSQIESFSKLNLIQDNIGIVATHSKNSHTSHTEGAHSNSSHSNGSEERISNRLDTVVNVLKEYNMTITPTELIGQKEFSKIPR